MMTQEDKKLLLKDLSARLPYGVKYNFGGNEGCDYTMGRISLIAVDDAFPIEDIKPYLRPMGSMTDKERKDWYSYSRAQYDCEFHPDPTLSLFESHLSVDWLVAHHFDYRGLIPNGLALEAPDGMYKF